MASSTKKENIVINILDKLKQYLGVIVLIPTILGGLWQLTELLSISISYVRFFSLSQVVPDGLLVLLIMIFIAFPIGFGFFSLKSFGIDFYKDPKKNGLKNGILMILLGATFFLNIQTGFRLIFIDEIRSGYRDIFYLLLMFIISIGSITIGVYLVYKYISLNFKIEENFSSKKKTKYKAIRITTLTIMLIGSLSFYIFLFHFIITKVNPELAKFKNSVLFSSKIKNYQNILCELDSEFGANIENEILYANDKYIFVNVKLSEKENIIKIFQFDVLFRDDECTESEKILLNNDKSKIKDEPSKRD